MPYSCWYAIIAAPPARVAPQAWGAGLHGNALRLVLAGDLAAVVSDWPQASVNRATEKVDADLVWQHEHVIERIMAGCTVLPVRFGTILASDQRIQETLEGRRAVFQADLARVDGCVELGLRVLWEPPAAAMAGADAEVVHFAGGSLSTPGTHYLARRAAEEGARQRLRGQGEALAEELGRSLRSGAVEMHQTVLQTERMLLASAFLVRRAEVPAFLQTVERLRGHYSQLAFLCSGPWPPYHFMSA